MIKSLLIANRGEIACRVMRTCRRMGIRTIAVYSDADAKAKHVRDADEAIHIGPSPATDSYLVADKILAAAKETGAEAIHPGYGFLSENTEFADAVESAGLIWVGPKADTIRAMGLKDEAKRIAEEANVPVLPGYRGEDQSLATLEAAADKIGFPLLIKAVAGGGGRGIREVAKIGELKSQLESAQREAKSAFGDDRVMLERLVERPRHIEVQVFGDSHGNVVHLYERDCSLQRRRQKVVEEAPAPGMTEDVRTAMTDAAVKLAKAVSYQGAGTVEFIVDGNGPLTPDSFWFLEMNTRLQVEHPVTEMITGLDLVEWQLRVASGEKIPALQGDISFSGHAIEARICAEDPANDFRPGIGKVERGPAPEAASKAHFRSDSGFDDGDTVSPFYDSMIEKLIVYEDDRASAITALEAELASKPLFGIPVNTGFLARCLAAKAFREGTHNVNWIAEEVEALTTVEDGAENAALFAAADAYLGGTSGNSPWDLKDGWRANSANARSIDLEFNETVHSVDLREKQGSAPSLPITTLSHDRYGVTIKGDQFLISRPNYEAAAEALEAGDDIKAPMPGKLLSLNVKAGDKVSADQALATMEAMKMEHTLTSPRDGVVAEICNAQAGAQINEGLVLVRLEPV